MPKEGVKLPKVVAQETLPRVRTMSGRWLRAEKTVLRIIYMGFLEIAKFTDSTALRKARSGERTPKYTVRAPAAATIP